MSFARETAINTIRKPRPCIGCGKRIDAGTPAVQWAGTTDGDFSSVTYHSECRAAEVYLNEQHGTYWDEWIGLHNLEHEDRELLRTEHPIVAGRLGIVALSTPQATDSGLETK